MQLHPKHFSFHSLEYETVAHSFGSIAEWAILQCWFASECKANRNMLMLELNFGIFKYDCMRSKLSKRGGSAA